MKRKLQSFAVVALLVSCSVCCLDVARGQDDYLDAEPAINKSGVERWFGHHVGPAIWDVGVQCMDAYAELFFQKIESITRGMNIVLTRSQNMTPLAAHIQTGFLKLVNERFAAGADATQQLRMIRIISDAEPYKRSKWISSELVRADYYVIIVDEIERLRHLMKAYITQMSSWNPGGRFFVVYSNMTNRSSEREVAHQIFHELLHKYYIHYVGVLYTLDDLKYSFSVLDYYNNAHCRSVRLRSFGVCENGVLEPEENILWNEMNDFLRRINFSNCTFNVCASIASPYVEQDCQGGMELNLIKYMAESLKFNVNQTCYDETRGIQLEDGGWTGLLGRLEKQDCDMVLGGYYPDNDVALSFWFSETYLFDSHTWYVKMATRRPAWEALYSIFTGETWLYIGAFFALTWLFWFAFVNILPEPAWHKDLSVTCINTLAVTICVAINERPLCHASRIFFFMMAIYGLNLVATYTSILISVFSNPGNRHQIASLGEVIQAGIPFGGPEESRDWFENDDDMWIYEAYNETYEYDLENLIEVRDGKRVVLCNRLYVLQVTFSEQLYGFEHNVFASTLQMVMKPGFPFMFQFNWFLRHLRSAGVYRRIENDYTYLQTYLNHLVKDRPAFPNNIIVLRPEHLAGAFIILLVGSSCGLVLFLGELGVHRLRASCTRRGRDDAERADAKRTKLGKQRKRRKDVVVLKRTLYKNDGDGYSSGTNSGNSGPMQATRMRFTPPNRRRVHVEKRKYL